MTQPIWTLEEIWNESLGIRLQREIKPRDYIYASELGGALIDTYLKMQGEEPSNGPNRRSKRKFDAGDIWEDITAEVLKRAGLLIKTQEHLIYQYPNLQPVHGRLDHYAGGRPNIEEVKKYFEGKDESQLTFLDRTSYGLAERLLAIYPDGVLKMILEIKSSSSYMFAVREKNNCADKQHITQCFHYLKSKGEKVGQVCYVNKDDCLMKSFFVNNIENCPEEIIYKKAIEEVSYYYQHKETPPKEKEVYFDEESLKFSKNWKVEYSNYLTMLYGYEEPEDYRERWDKDISKFNRVFNRVVKGDKMTKANLEIVAETKANFPDYDKYVDLARLKIKSNK